MDLLGNNFDPRLLLAVVVLVGLLVWETVQPYIAQFARDRVGLKNRGRHAAWNLGVGIVNSVMVALFFVWLWQASTQWASTSGFGLLNLWELPASARLFAAVILLDFWKTAFLIVKICIQNLHVKVILIFKHFIMTYIEEWVKGDGGLWNSSPVQ